MRTQSILKAVVVVVLPLLLASGALPDRESGLAEIRAGIHATNQEFREAFRAADADRLASLFTRDAQIMVPLRPTVNGREEIREYMEYWIQFGIRDLDIVTEEVYGSGETALEIGSTTSYLSNGQQIGHTRDMALWRYEDGRWLVHRLLSN